MTMKLTGGVVADWQAVSTEQQQRGERERESSEVGYVKRTIYILAKICNPKIKLCCFILFFYFLNSPIKLKRFVSLSHILGNKNHRFIASSSLLELDSNQKNWRCREVENDIHACIGSVWHVLVLDF